MTIDFTLTRQRRELQLESRKFAAEVLAKAKAFVTGEILHVDGGQAAGHHAI